MKTFLSMLLEPHYRHPSGLLGRYAGRRMAARHRPENVWTVDLLDPRPGDQILEVGFGPGMALAELAVRFGSRRASSPQPPISGLDYSRTMVATAARRNAAAIERGLVELHCGNVKSMPYAGGRFNKAFSIHGIYLWPDPLAALGELRRVLEPSGFLALTFLPIERWAATGLDVPQARAEFRPYSGEELCQMLVEAGFSSPRVEADLTPGRASNHTILADR